MTTVKTSTPTNLDYQRENSIQISKSQNSVSPAGGLSQRAVEMMK